MTGSSVEGKYFAETIDHALQWGNILFGMGHFRVVEVTLALNQVAQFYRFAHLDGIGPALFAEIEQVDDAEAQIQEVVI